MMIEIAEGDCTCNMNSRSLEYIVKSKLFPIAVWLAYEQELTKCTCYGFSLWQFEVLPTVRSLDTRLLSSVWIRSDFLVMHAPSLASYLSRRPSW
jgi:hypothetical protein